MILCDRNCVILRTNRARCALYKKMLDLLDGQEFLVVELVYKFDEKSYQECLKRWVCSVTIIPVASSSTSTTPPDSSSTAAAPQHNSCSIALQTCSSPYSSVPSSHKGHKENELCWTLIFATTHSSFHYKDTFVSVFCGSILLVHLSYSSLLPLLFLSTYKYPNSVPFNSLLVYLRYYMLHLSLSCRIILSPSLCLSYLIASNTLFYLLLLGSRPAYCLSSLILLIIIICNFILLFYWNRLFSCLKAKLSKLQQLQSKGCHMALEEARDICWDNQFRLSTIKPFPGQHCIGGSYAPKPEAIYLLVDQGVGSTSLLGSQVSHTIQSLDQDSLPCSGSTESIVKVRFQKIVWSTNII